MSNEELAEKIVAQLGLACGLDCTTVAIETVEECLGADADRDLEVWRQAYNAALSGYDIQRCLAERSDYLATYDPKERADRALADYRAKREEMGL